MDKTIGAFGGFAFALDFGLAKVSGIDKELRAPRACFLGGGDAGGPAEARLLGVNLDMMANKNAPSSGKKNNTKLTGEACIFRKGT